MKNFNTNFLSTAISDAAEPQAYVKIETSENYDIYLTTHQGIVTVTAPDTLVDGVISGLKTSSESVTPEKGVSVTGRGSVSLNEAEFTDELRDLINVDKTVFNNKVEIFAGDASLNAADFEKVNTLYLEDITSTDVSYNLSLITPQVFTDKQIFEKQTTELFTGFSSDQILTEIEVVDTTGFELVAHDAHWENSPNEEVGYLTFIGQDANSNPVTEIMKYWSKDATKFYGDPSNGGIIERSVFRSGLVTTTGTADSDTASAVEEYVYIDLAVGKLLIALLTGDLYGQVGKTLPIHWHAGITPDFVNLTSFEEIGFDLWNPSDSSGFHLRIDNLNAANSKNFIAREILRVASLVFLTDVNGEIAAKRYSQVIQGASTVTVLDDNDLTNKPRFNRKSGDIKNIFSVSWDYDQAAQKFNRHEVFNDPESQARNGVVSGADVIRLKTVRNNQVEVGDLLKTVTDGIRTRLTNAKLTPSITTNFRRSASLELMDVIGLDLTGFADYSDAGDINRPFEIQSIQHDWLNRSVNMKLFGSTDKASPIDIDASATTAIISSAGRLPFESHLTGSFTDTGSVLTLTSNCLLGTIGDFAFRKYYYDGDIILDGFTLLTVGSVSIDAKVFDATDSKISGEAQGGIGGVGQLANESVNISTIKGDSGYFGNYDSAGEGVKLISLRSTGGGSSSLNGWLYRELRGNDTKLQGENSGVNFINNFALSVDQSGNLSGEPAAINGQSGSGGFRATSQPQWSQPFVGAARGGNGANGGGGCFIYANNFVYNLATVIDMSAGNLTDLPPVQQTVVSNSPDWNVTGGLGGMAWGGCFGVFIKDRSNPLFSNNDGNFTSKCSTRVSHTGYTEINRPHEGRPKFITRDSSELNASFSNISADNNVDGVDYANSAFISKYIGAAVVNVPQVGRDTISLVPAPTNLVLTESIDTPSTPLGNLSTVTTNVTPPTDANYSHATFEFRLITQDAFYPLTYKVPDESSFEVESNGATYEVKAQSVSKQGVLGGIVTGNVTVKNVLTEPAIEPSVQIPKVTGLQLKNRIAPNELAKFKSGNAEFVWNASSNRHSVPFGQEGFLGAGAGSYDSYSNGYQVTIFDSAGIYLRDEFTSTEAYTYTLEKNKVDGAGRDFFIQVLARGNNNQVGEGVKFKVENPQPESVTGIKTTVGYNSIQVEYVAPDDIDFVGVNVRYKKTGGVFSAFVLFATTACQVGGLDSGQEYEIELQSVDQFGAGATTSTITSTQAIEAAEIDGLSNWATETNPVDLAFIQANMDNGAVESDKIVSLAAAKITAGQIDVTVDVGTGVRLDGANGTVQTTTNDFNVIVGSSDGTWNQLPNPTAITNLNTSTNTQTFGVDVFGNTIIGNGDDSVLFNQATNTIDFGSNVTIGSNVDQTVTVGSGGDYATLNLALEHLSKIVPAYKSGGFTATINILSGTVIAEQIWIDSVDLSFISIESVDSIVEVNTGSFVITDNNKIFIAISGGGQSPLIATIFKSQNQTQFVTGLNVNGSGSFAKIERVNSGIIDFYNNISAENGGSITAEDVTLTGAINRAIVANGMATILASSSDASNSKFAITSSNSSVEFNFGVARFCEIVVSASTSNLLLKNADFSDWLDLPNMGNVVRINSGSNVDMRSVNLTALTNSNNRTSVDINGSVAHLDLADFVIGSSTVAKITSSSSTINITFSSFYNITLSKGSIVRGGSSVSDTYSPATLNTTLSTGIVFK